MRHESFISENCFRPYGCKGFNEQELNYLRGYATWPYPTDTQTMTLPGAAAATYPRDTNT